MLKKRYIITSLVLALATLAGLTAGPVTKAIAQSASPTDVGANIVGGHNAEEPWAVSLQSIGPNGASHECGGVLIAPKWVMTAAHCEPYVGGQARIGSLNWKEGGEVISVADVYSHPYHDSSRNFGYDLALVKLTVAAKTAPVAIGVYGGYGSTGIAQGWGIICDFDVTAPGCGDQTPDFLKELEMRREKDSFCDLKNAAGVQLNHHPTMMCLVTADGSQAGTCFGDSGSPFLQDFGNTKAVTGIIIAIMNNTVPTPHVCSQTPSGGINRDAATEIAPLLPWVIQTLVQHDSEGLKFVQSHLVGN